MGFENGVWKCNCNPPLPATMRTVIKKENGNKGKLFYCCVKEKDDPTKCRFFMFHEQALQYESTVLQAARDNPNSNVNTPIKRKPSPPPAYTVEAGPSEPRQKRKRSVSQDPEDEFDGDVDDNELNDILTEFETPTKAAKTAHFTTPTTTRRKLSWQKDRPNETIAYGLPTPQTNRRQSNNPFGSEYPAPGSSFFTPAKDNEEEYRQTATPSSSFETPTRSRIQNTGGEDLAHDVLALLREANIVLPNNSERELKALLSKHARRAEGYRKGRDLAQQTVKARDARVNELNLRIRTLEEELDTEKKRVELVEWEAQNPGTP